jgi:ribosomal protein L7/L12
MNSGNKLAAIKALRAYTSWGLKESLDVVDAFWPRG